MFAALAGGMREMLRSLGDAEALRGLNFRKAGRSEVVAFAQSAA